VSLFITSLNSGSNGNCYYIGNGQQAVLVDAGISCKEIEKRMERKGLNPDRLKAIFVSHEHSDHILGIPVLAKKYQLPVYITSATYEQTGWTLDKSLLFSFEAGQPILIGNLKIIAFAKQHDASDPHSFIVSSDDVTVGIFTDIGSASEELISYFKKCHAAFLETNYDDGLLRTGSYPLYLKARISGEKGHFSNKQAFELFVKHRSPFLNHLILSHLSKENNSPAIVESLFKSISHNVNIVLASRERETAVFHIKSQNNSVNSSACQLSLF
jgi:phosphoribosyl 1,2-cyclic phosphodiesterase